MGAATTRTRVLFFQAIPFGSYGVQPRRSRLSAEHGVGAHEAEIEVVRPSGVNRGFTPLSSWTFSVKRVWHVLFFRVSNLLQQNEAGALFFANPLQQKVLGGGLRFRVFPAVKQSWNVSLPILSKKQAAVSAETTSNLQRVKRKCSEPCSSRSHICLWLTKPVPKWNPGKWKHGPKPAVCPSSLILSHSHLSAWWRISGCSPCPKERVCA